KFAILLVACSQPSIWRPRWSPIARVYRRDDIGVVQRFSPVGEPVLAVYRTPAGRWAIVAPCCRDLSGRTGVRRIAVLDEPAAGEAEVIELERARRDRLAGPAPVRS